MVWGAEDTAVSKLPPRLQYEFTSMVNEAAEALSKRLQEESGRVERLRKFLAFRNIGGEHSGEDYRGFRVGVVDGSISPELNERTGRRLGVYTVSYMVFEGMKVVSDDDDESMGIGYIVAPQTGAGAHARKILNLLSTYHERVMAHLCMKKYDLDLLIIDGSFFGFRAWCSKIKNKSLEDFDGVLGFSRVSELIDETYEISKKLAENSRVVGVVKRVRTQAVDGWLYSRGWRREDMTALNDKLILSKLMKRGELFDYRDLLGDAWSYHHYSNILTWLNDVENRILQKCKEEEKFEKVMKYIDSKIKTQIKTDLCIDEEDSCADERYSSIIGMKRAYLKACDLTQPICVEFGDAVDLDTIVGYLISSVNDSTGLPFPLDIVDSNITLDRRIAKEFADEVEVRLLDLKRIEARRLREDFLSWNPQKG